MAATRAVIVGGGMVGLEAARRLERSSAEIDTTVVDAEGASVYQPLLPEVAGGVIDARHAVVPLQAALPRARVVAGQAVRLDAPAHEVTVRRVDGSEEPLAYDHLIVAPGSVTKLLPVPGLDEHAIGFQTVAEAVRLRDHVLDRVQVAAATADAAARARALTFVFVGAGYSGVEAAGELQDLAAAACRHQRDLSPADLRFVLVEATDTVLPMVGESLRRAAVDELTGRGVDVRLETTVDRVDDAGAHLSDGDVLATDSLVWCAGVTAHPTVAMLGLPTDDSGKIDVDATLAVRGLPDVWAAGDAAAVPDLEAGGLCPPSAQYALRQGRHLAHNVEGAATGRAPESFRYRQIGELITLGRLRAVGEIEGVGLSGLPAWLVRAGYHVARFPTWQRKLRITLEWLIRLASARDTTSLGFARDPGAAIDRAAEARDEGTDRPSPVL